MRWIPIFPTWTSAIYWLSSCHPFLTVLLLSWSYRNILFMGEGVCFWAPYSVSLISFPLSMLTLLSHNHCGFIIFGIWQAKFPYLAVGLPLFLFFLHICSSSPPSPSLSSSCILGPLFFHISFRVILPSFTEKCYWDFSCSCVVLIIWRLYVASSSYLGT